MSAWMQVFMEVKDPPSLQNPPPFWKNVVIPPGTPLTFYAYEHVEDKRDWVTGEIIGEQYVWKRAYFWVPPGKYDLMRLGTGNVWKCIAIMEYPDGVGYLSFDSIDGTVFDANNKDTGNGGSLKLVAHVED